MNEVQNHTASAGLFSRLPITPIIVFVGVLVVGGLIFLRPQPHPRDPVPPAPQLVSVVYAKPQTQSLTVVSQGEVEPQREIDLVVQVSGLVTKVNTSFVDGGFFSAGEVLFEIDPRDYQLALIQSEARVAETRQALATEKGRALQAKREWRDLGNPDANDLFLRKPQLAAAEAQLEAAIAERDKAKLSLDRTRVTVPFDGRVREATVDIGQYVSPGNRVGRVYDTAVAEIRLPLTDKQASLVNLPLGFAANEQNPGPSVVISGLIAGERYQWQGEIVRTEASIDTNSRMYYAVTEVRDPFIANPERAQVPLVIGLFVDAKVGGKEIENLVTLPRRALYKTNQVYTLDSDNQVQIKTVRVLNADRDTAWVKGDFDMDEPVIVGGQSFLTSGQLVAPLPAKEFVARSL